MQLKCSIWFFFITLFSINFAFSAETIWYKSQNKAVQTKLIASFYKKDNSKKLIAGLHFKIKKGWKIYSNDQNGIGFPPSFDFSNSKNYNSHKIFWPEAQIEKEEIDEESIEYSVYKDEVIIPIEIDLKQQNQPSNLVLKVNYGLCKDICIPESTNLLLEIPNKIDIVTLQKIKKFYPTLDFQNNPGTIKKANFTKTFLYTIFLAIIGGMILNIMPCVLPVLSIKLLSIIEHSNATIGRIRFAFFSTIVGILFCFIIFSFLALIIKLTGNSLGWGLQFQNPYFLIFLIIVLTLFTANLIGIFEISFEQIFATLLNKKISQAEKNKNIFISNFLSGVLAVLLATPCSAPFLGSAISFALVKDFSVITIVFLAIGFGFSLPYVILIISPHLIKFLPKPGSWMLRIKQLMAVFLAITIIWLIYVLSNNLSTLLALFISAVSIAIFTFLKLKKIPSLIRHSIIIALAIIAFASPPYMQQQKTEQTNHDILWRGFNEAEIHNLVAEGKVVLIDITADWCITCKFNKARVLNSSKIVKKLKNGTIIGMRGDITKPNEEIMDFLHKHNRFAIPFNAVYGPNAKNGLLTSELLTQKELIKLIKKAK